MNNKAIGKIMLIIAVCVIMMGCVFKFGIAESAKGVKTSTGIVVDGKYKELSSGTMGGSARIYEENNVYGNVFLLVGVVVGVVGIIFIKDKKIEKV